MLRTSARRGLVGGTALAVGVAGLAISQGAALAAAPLPADQAGPAAIWGPGPSAAPFTMPSLTEAQQSQAFTKVVANAQGSANGLTADGKVELIGSNPYESVYSNLKIPTAALADKTVVDITGGSSGEGMALTSDHDVYAWFSGFENWATELPGEEPGEGPGLIEALHGSTSVAIATNGALAAVVKDGIPLLWGNPAESGTDYSQLTPPDGLTDAASVIFGDGASTVFALKTNGTLVGWGRHDVGQTDLPNVTTDASDDVDVTDVVSRDSSSVALLSDGTLAAWGQGTASHPITGGGGTPNEPPAATDGKEIVALAANSRAYFAFDSAGEAYVWGDNAILDTKFRELPEGVDPANITGLAANDTFAIAIQATFGFVAKPAITGTATVGQTLTATPATFTDTPDDTMGQWLANGTEIASATDTTYKLTSNELGKTISYRETATRGEATATATSDPTAKVIAATVDSATAVSAPATAYGHGGAVTVTVRNGKAGTVTLAGAGATQRKAISGGRAVFALPRTLGAGNYALSASYSGTTGVNRSAGTATLRVVRAAAGPVRAKVLKASKLTRKKKGKATVTVATAAGLAKATGRVTITLKKGKQTKRVTRVLRNGKVTTKLPKLPKKGKWKVTVTYTGDANYLAGSSRPIKVRVR
jgi:hypothetical protein